MGTLKARGIPRELDAFLRPPARLAQLVIGGGGTALLLCLGWWWYAPLPLALSFLIFEAMFAGRSDKPIALALESDKVTLDDRFVDQRRVVDLTDVSSATLVYRSGPDETVEAVIVLANPRAIVLALRLKLPASRFAARPVDVDADLCNAVLGSISGLIRALAPREAMIRQPFDDPAVLEWFRERFDDATWARSVVRVWEGAEPELDLFGYHAQPASGLLALNGDHVALDDGPSLPISPASPSRSERTAILFRMYGEEHEESAEQLPLWLQPVAGRTVAIPAPLVDPALPELVRTEDLLHVHPPEGAVLLWHLWRTIPRERWPEAWTEALRHARPTLVRWPEGLPLPD